MLGEASEAVLECEGDGKYLREDYSQSDVVVWGPARDSSLSSLSCIDPGGGVWCGQAGLTVITPDHWELSPLLLITPRHTTATALLRLASH